MLKRLAAPRAGSTMVMAAIMMSAMFGMLGLSVDLGTVIMHRRQQQNAADSAAMGVARQLAASVARAADGTIIFLGQTDAGVMTRAQTLASGNWLGPASSRTIGIEYLDCAGVVIRSAVSGANTQVPGTTCQVRATGASTLNTAFIRVLGTTTSSASARATARIAPTAAPNRVTGVWPITRQMDHQNSGTNCAEFGDTLCMFWGNNGGNGDTSIGSFKEKLFFSRKSQYYCPALTVDNMGANYDPNRPGSPCGSSSEKQLDTEYWMRNGFGGYLELNSWVEVDASGVQGNNYALAMQDYILAKPDGYDTLHTPSRGYYRDVHLVLWKKGNSTSGWGAQQWQNSTSSFVTWTTNSGTPDRVQIANIYCFRFYSVASFPNSGEIWGNRINCFEPNSPPQAGPPSDVANTVQMVN